MALWWYFVL